MPILGRSAQLVVNGLGESPAVAPWVNVQNVMIQGGGSFAYAGQSFAVQNLGAYHFTQDIAIPPGDIATVDAAERAVDYTAAAAIISLASTATMYLKALDAGGAVLQTWQASVLVADKPYTPLTVSMVRIPVGTRTMRIGCQGVNGFANSGWFDNMQMYFDDLAIDLTKGTAYVASGPPAGVLLNQKSLGYLVEGMGFRETLQTSKAVLYAVSAATYTLALLKGVMYVVTAPPCGYDGVVLACADRPVANVFEECGTRPDNVIAGCGAQRPAANTFQTDQQIERCQH